jgi:threonine synthase
MKYLSTRGKAEPVSLAQAIEAGLAPDGGLYVPERFPKFRPHDFAPHLPHSEDDEPIPSLASVATTLLTPFFEPTGGDESPLSTELAQIARAALDFPVPLKPISSESLDTSILELFHGPTAAFKDIGARFLAECFERIPLPPRAELRTILVATSGDTGGAVAAAFSGRKRHEVVILYPKGGVSPLQEQQLTCWGGNVRAFAVNGTFDDCQRLAKEAFAARATSPSSRVLTSANSISVGRLLPQAAYYAHASLTHFKRSGGEKPGFVIPSGNVGNALAALWAMKMGLPIGEIVLATNANRTVPDYFESGEFNPSPTIRTLANAMDVGNPSNLERVIALLDPALRPRIRAVSVSDDEIRSSIRDARARYGQILCPHTAAAYNARQSLDGGHWVIVATAHPAKFNEVIEPLLGSPAPMPPQLAELMKRESRKHELKPELSALRQELG